MFESMFAFFQQPWVYNTLMTIYGITVIVILGVVLSENRNPVKSLAWVTVLILLPMVGIVFYIFFGRNIKNTRMISRRNRRRLRRAERTRQVDISKQGLNDASLKQIRLARSLCGTLYYPQNKATVFTNGASKFAALKEDLRSAKHYINLQYYIIADDKIGNEIRDILINRANAGVKVRIIYDHVGSLHTSRRFFKEMKQAGIEVYPFFRVAFPPFGTRINWRNHRKLCVIDGRVGYVGGMNIADRYIDGGKAFRNWRDTHLRIEGSAVSALQYSFAVDWNFMGRPLLEDPIEPEASLSQTMGMQLITSGPTSQWSNVAYMYHRAITSAKSRILVQTPYFLPTDGLLKSLQTAALSGVDVRIMIPRHSDSKLLTYASASYITECLRSGIKIYFYNNGMLHAKTLVVDDELVSVGSTNFDFRSFEHNFEANMFVYSKEFNNRMADIFFADITHCTRILPAKWAHRRRRDKILESIIRLLAPIL